MNIKNRKKILFIIPSLDIGGTENICKTLFIELSKNIDLKIELLILNKNRNNNFYNDIESNLKENIFFSKHRNWFYISILLTKLMYFSDYNSIFCFNAETALIINIIKKLSIKKTKIIFRVNNSIKNKIYNYNNYIRARLIYIYHLISLLMSDIIIVQSFQMKSEIKDIIKSDHKIKVIYNTLSNKFSKYNSTFKKESYLLFVGSFKPKKNPLMILKIYNQFIKNHKTEITLKMVGSGEEISKIKKFIKENNLKNKVELIKPLSQNKLQEVYSKALCLIISSKYEGFPNVAIESLFCGTPLLAYKGIGGINELIENKTNGIIVSSYSINSYLEGLKMLLKIKFDRSKIINTSNKFNTNILVQSYADIF